MSEHPLTTAWESADAATRTHWIDEIVSLSDDIARIRAKNEDRRRRAAEAGVSYEEMLRRDNDQYWSRRITEESVLVGTDKWNARKAQRRKTI
ncbi:MAG: hypothetical protein ACRCUT_14630 [Spirochaetota bacterium]